MRLKSSSWNAFTAVIEFEFIADGGLFLGLHPNINFNPEVIAWLEEMAPQRYCIWAGPLPYIAAHRLWFLAMSDAIHFKMRWS